MSTSADKLWVMSLTGLLIGPTVGVVLSAQVLVNNTTSTVKAHSIYSSNEQMFGEMPLVAPLFLQTDQIDSAINVVNAITFSVPGIITLRDQAGAVISSKKVTFPSHSSTSISVKDLITAAGSQAHSGSVTLSQDAQVKGPALLAQMSMSMHTGSETAFLEEEFGMPTAHGSSILQGVASQSLNLPLVAVTSVSDTAQTVTAVCLGAQQHPHLIELPARGTALVQACSWKSVPDALMLLASPLASNTATIETDHALVLTSDSVPGSFYAFGLSLNGDLAHASLQPLDFYDPGMLSSNSISYVGVPTGESDLFNTVLSAPVLTVANFSVNPKEVEVIWSDSSSGIPRVTQVATISVGPLTTKTTKLSSIKGLGILNTITLSSDGRPGDIQAHLFTLAGTSKQRTELLAKDTKDDHNGGDHPWSIANGDKSTLLLYNSSPHALPFHVRVSGGGDTWVKAYTLSPSETRAISLNEILAKRVSDVNRHVLSPSIQRGEVQWNTEHGGMGLGRLLVTNNTVGLARSFSCTTYYNLCSASFGPSNFANVIYDGATLDLSAIEPLFCTEYSSNSCAQNSPVGNSSAYSFSTNWQNSDAVSQVSSTQSDLQVRGISPGSYSVTAFSEAGSCQAGPMQGGGTVQTPTYFFSSAATSVLGGCYSPDQGSFYDVTYYVADQSSTRVSQSGMTPLELAPGTNGKYNSFASPTTTSSTGSFDDYPVGTCFSGLAKGAQQCVTVNVSYQLQVGNQTDVIQTNTLRTDCAQGQTINVQGNPQGQNNTYTQGKVN